MAKTVKFFLYALCIIVLLITIGAIALLLLFNPNHYKQEISRSFYSQTGCKLQINGDITWSFFPSLSLQLNDVIIQNPTQFETDKPLATLGNVGFSVKLSPLFRRHVETKNVKANNITVNAIQKAPKQLNLATLVDNFVDNNQQSIKSQPKTAVKKSKAHQAITQGDFKLTIDNIVINNARINWEDLEQQQSKTMIIDSLRGSQISFDGKPFPLESKLTLHTAPNDTTAQIRFTSVVRVDLCKQHLKLTEMKATSHLSGPDIPNHKMSLSIASTVSYDFSNTQLAITDLTAALDNLAVQGELVGKLDQLTLQGNLNAPKFDSLKWLQGLGYSIDIPNTSLLQNTKFSATFAITPQQINLSALDIGLSKNVTIAGSLNFLLPQSKVLGNIIINTLDLDQIFPLVITQPSVSQTTNLSTVKPTIGTPKPTIEKLPKTTKIKTSPAVAIDAAIEVSQLMYKKLTLENFVGKFTWQNKLISMGFTDADFYGGKASGMDTIKLHMPLQIAVNNVLQNVALEPLLIDLTGTPWLKGNATITADLHGNGETINELLPTLSGNTKITISDGEIDILDAFYLLDFAVASYDKTKLPAAPRKRITKFQTLDANFVTNNGIAKADKLTLVSSELTATGHGKINLVKQKLNLEIDLHYTGKDKKILELQKKVGGAIPIIIKGHFADLRAEVDYPLLLSRAATTRLEKNVKQVEKQVGKLGDNVNQQIKEVGKQLQNFFH